jgi:prepilin-type N-terminal cleavage/methylation domain-containing protein
MHALTAQRSRRGFTLVEMLVVVVIIGILAGLITAAAQAAKRAARKGVVRAEINDLDLAIKAFKEKFGDYPPDFGEMAPAQRTAAVQRFLQKAFPRYTGTWPPAPPAVNPLQGYSGQDPATALVFWLGGMIDANGNFAGFSANPANPFELPSVTPSRIQSFFDFDRKRLKMVKVGNTMVIAGFMPSNGIADSHPYLYFRPNYYQIDPRTNKPRIVDQRTQRPDAKGYQVGTFQNKPVYAKAYFDAQLAGNSTWNTPDAFWVNRTTFQILSPGLDGKYWNDGDAVLPGVTFPTGEDYTRAQYDDIANFSDGALEDKMP